MTKTAQSLAELARALVWTPVALIGLLTARLGNRDPDRRDAATGEVLRRYLLRMGPLYVKAGQILATQSGVIPHATAQQFRTFLSELDPMPGRRLDRVLRSGSTRAAFAEFDRTPVAVGSVAQVHRAVLRDGRPVAVKVVKAGVRDRLATGCGLMENVLRIAGIVLPVVRRFELTEQFRQVRPLLEGQADLLGEAQRQRRVAENFRNHPHLRVPQVYDEYCSDDVLVMEFVTGTPGQDVRRCPAPGPLLADRLQDALYCMTYFHGFFHVDPHPGNVLFGDDGEILLLDFGLVGELTEDEKWNLSSFYYAAVQGNWDRAVERFGRTFVAGDAEDLLADQEYRAELMALLDKHFVDEKSRWSTMTFFDDATRLLRRRGRRVTGNLATLALALLTGEGFVASVDPGIDIWANARRFTDKFSPFLSDQARTDFAEVVGTDRQASVALRERAADSLVAPTHLDRFVLPSAFPLMVSSASGCRLTDVDGRSYIDLSCGYGPHLLGYAHPAVVDAVTKAIADGAVNALGNPAEIELAELICEAFGRGTRTILSNSGTEAVLMALRLARAHTGRDLVAKFEGHYHGFSDAATVSSWFRYRGPADAPEPVANSAGGQRSVTESMVILQYGTERALQIVRQRGPELAAVILEPMPTALAEYDAPFLAQLRQVCTEQGVVLIFDEVVSGFRVAHGGAQQLAGVTPDLTCLGKVIGGGLPCGAVVGRTEVIEAARTTGDPFLDVDTRAFVGGTMSGNSVTAAAGAAVLRHLRDNPEVYTRLARHTDLLTQRLETAVQRVGVPCLIRGNRSIFSITFDHARPRTVRDRLAGTNVKANLALAYHMRAHGIYLPELHTMLLSDAHTPEDLAAVADAFEHSLALMNEQGFFTV